MSGKDIERFKSLLRIGDMRTTGKADEIANEVVSHQERFPDLFECLYSNDSGVRMRAADAIEKASAAAPDLLIGFNARILDLLGITVQQEVCWHLAQIVNRVSWSDEDVVSVIEILTLYLQHKSRIVVVSAMEALVDFAITGKMGRSEVARLINHADSSPSIVARRRNLLGRLNKN